MPQTDEAEPTLSASAFTQRCRRLAIPFCQVLGLASGELSLVPEITDTEAMLQLAGRASEKIERNRGKDHPVIPLCPISDEIFVWTGYREGWQKGSTDRSFRFVEAGFTLHIGRKGELSKPQILRSEWVGRRSSAFVGFAGAGHPHWQLDVLESARNGNADAPIRFRDPSEPRTVLEFDERALPTIGNNILMGLTVERMHLASAALWWRESEVSITHTPSTVKELDQWVLKCIAYLRQEAGRCTIVAAPT